MKIIIACLINFEKIAKTKTENRAPSENVKG
jgi:hypothetical protein